MTNILSWVTFLPLLGAVALLLLGRADDEIGKRNFKRLSLGITVATFLLSLVVLFGFDASDTDFQFVEEGAWVVGLTYRLGVDGISVLFVLLTTMLMPVVILASWSIDTRVKEYFVAFLALETLMLGVFVSLDMVLFYIFFEAGLIPMFLIIGIWGGKNRIYASFKFFLYTLAGSLLMLVAMIYMISFAGSSDIRVLLTTEFPHEAFSLLGINLTSGAQTLLWIAFFASFAVKMPMWPFHTWLPDAHVQAPTAGSVILASIMLKLGGYGFIRFSLPMFTEASVDMQSFVFFLSATAIVYTSLVAMVQTDMKRVIAYSSVAHMGYVTMGIFAMNQQGLDGAIFQMLSHGFISGALFLIVGVIYDRMHTREIDAFGGLVVRMPVYALFFMFFTMANIGLPGTSGFVGEFLTLVGVYQVSTWTALFATSGVVLSAGYALWLYRRVALGDLIKESLKSIRDVNRREKWMFAPLIAFTLFLGVYPSFVLDRTGPAVASLVSALPDQRLEFQITDAPVTEAAHGETVENSEAGMAEEGLDDAQVEDTQNEPAQAEGSH